MGQLVKYEWGKIWSRKIVWIGLTILMFLNWVNIWAQSRVESVVTHDGRELYGEDCETYITEHTKRYAGLLNDEKMERILEEEAPAEIFEDSYYDGLPLYLSMNENFKRDDGPFYGMTVDEAFTKRGITVEVGEVQRWMDTINYFQTTMLFLGLVIVMGVSGVFSEEYSRKTDALLLTSRHGKRLCVRAKLLASFLFTFTCYGGILLTVILPFLINGGLKGWDAGVQLDSLAGLYLVPYTLNCGQAALLLMFGGLLGLLMLTAETLFISVLSRTSFVSVIAGEGLYLLPVALSTVLETKIIGLTPLGAMLSAVLTLPKFRFAGFELLFYAKIALVTVIVILISWAASWKIFAGHQVK